MSKPLMARLDRLLSNMGYGSRREVQTLAATGKVLLDGQALKNAGVRIAVTADLPQRMTINGQAIDPPAPLTLMLNKPLGVVCSHTGMEPRIYDLLPRRWQLRDPTLSTVGRLDKDSSGLILITDDGPLLHRIISPKAHVDKRYRVELDRPLAGDEGETFAAGGLMLESEDKPLLPARLEVLGPKSAAITISEGRYHQVRRMFAAVGNHVTALHRDAVGGLVLPADLAPGTWRVLTPADLDAVFDAASG